MFRARKIALTALALAGCGPVLVPPDQAGTGEGSTTLAVDEASASASVGDEVTGVPPDPTTTTATVTSTSTSTTAEATTFDDGNPFIVPPDGASDTIECDIWGQDCPPGEKCMPWANDGGGAWNATRCSPVARDAGGVGDPCTVEGSGVSGIDDCELGAMCWSVDPETNMGECVGFCQGSEANPTCADPCTSCNLSGEGVLILCLPHCDPLAQDCDEGEACYPVNEFFACAPDASGEVGAIGDACEWINACDPGNFCGNADVVPGCAGASGCCAPFCNVDAPDTCDALLPGTACVPWYEMGQEPEGCITGTIGGCMVPP